MSCGAGGAAPALPSPSQAAVGYAAASPGEEPGQVSSLLTFTACPDSGGTSDKPLQQPSLGMQIEGLCTLFQHYMLRVKSFMLQIF